MQALYGLLVAFLRLVASIFFRQVEVVGEDHIPARGPAIFVGNHPNSLLDPVLLTTTCRRRVHFLAKDTLWSKPWLLPLLNILGAVPVRRRVDHGKGEGGKLDNASAFDALYELLQAGGFCGVFPEGISHAGSELAPLKTGAARIALGAARSAANSSAEPVRIVPCGLTYHRRTRMRGRVLVQYGEPLEIDAGWLARAEEDERATVRALTDEIDQRLRGLTINAPDFDTLRVLDEVRRLYIPADRKLPSEQKAEITRRFLDHYAEYKERPEVTALYDEVAEYQGKLDALGLRDHHLRHPVRGHARMAIVLKHWLLVFVLAPLALPGLLIHAPALLMAVFAGDGLTGRRDVVATTKMMTTTLLVLLGYAVIVGLIFWRVQPLYTALWAAGAAAVLLPVSLWATIRVLERQSALRRALWVLGIGFVLRRELVRLRARRAELSDKIWQIVDELIDPRLERIIAVPPEEA